MLSPNEVVKKVAKLVFQGNTCYIDRKTREISTIEITDDESKLTETLEENIEKYIKVLPMPTQVLGFAMKDFLQEVTDQEVRKELINGLKRNNPTRNFLQVVESRYDIQQHWIHFKADQCEEYVKKIFINEYNY